MKKVKPGTAATCLTKTTDRVEIHEEGEARYGGKLFNQNPLVIENQTMVCISKLRTYLHPKCRELQLMFTAS